MLTGTGLAQPMIGAPVDKRDQREQHRPDPVDMRERIERQPSEHARRRIAKPVRRPRVRRLVKGKREDQDDRDGNDVFEPRQA